MKYIFGLAILFLMYLLINNQLERQYQKGYQDATKQALKTNPPSEEFELACLGLWLGEQNKKHQAKETKSK